MTATPLTDPRRALAAAFLEENLRALRVPPLSAAAIREAEPAGEFLTLPDGGLALRRGEVVLGAPSTESLRQAAYADVGRLDSAVVFGLGVGHVARDLQARGSRSVVVCEPDPGIARRILEAGPTDLEGLTLVTSPDDIALLWSLSATRPSANLICSPGYRETFGAEHGAVDAVLRRVVSNTAVSLNTGMARGREWLAHVFENLPLMTQMPPVLALQGALEGVPAFIVGAGPSLQKNIEQLGDAVRRGVVIAVDVAGRALARKGIRPHFLVTVEGQNLYDELKTLPWIDEVIVSASLAGAPQTVRELGRSRLHFHEGLSIYQSLSPLLGVPPVSVGGSVSTVAFSIAERLGCNPIVLVGQDLAYTGGRTHAEGTMFQEGRVSADPATGGIRHTVVSDAAVEIRKKSSPELGPGSQVEELLMVPGWGGSDEVASTPVFQVYRTWFEVVQRVVAEHKPSLRLINATEGGSRIHGWEERSLAEVLEPLAPGSWSVSALLDEASRRKPPLESAEVVRWSALSARMMSRVRRRAHRVRDAVSQALEAIGTGSEREAKGALEGLDASEKDLATACAAHSFVEAHAYRMLVAMNLAAAERAEGDAKDDALWALSQEQKLAEVYADSADALQKDFMALARKLSPRTPSSHQQSH